MKNIFSFLFALLTSSAAISQSTRPELPVSNPKAGIYALQNATVYTPSGYVQNATLLIEKSKIISVGAGINVPENAIKINCEGLYIYPSFVELNSSFGLPKPEKKKVKRPQYNRTEKGAFGWNEAIKTTQKAVEDFKTDKDHAEKLQKLGIGSVLTHYHDGIARGTGAAVAVLTENENKAVFSPQPSAHFSFQKGTSSQEYPNSLMGAMALLRQTAYDAEWRMKQDSIYEANLTLDMWNKQFDNPVNSLFFHVQQYRDALRALDLAQEWDKEFIIAGTGDEYKRISEFEERNASRFVIPLKLPKAPDVSDPYDAMYASLEEMKHWEMAPSNAALLSQAGFEVALSTHKIEKWSDLTFMARQLQNNGFLESDLIESLTMTPAKFINAEEEVGSIEKGKFANFIITSDKIFSRKSELLENWVMGERHELKPIGEIDIRGDYDINIENEIVKIEVGGKKEKVEAKIEDDKIKFNREKRLVTIVLEKDVAGMKAPIRLSGKINFGSKIWDGRGKDADGNWFTWSAIRQKQFDENEKEKKEEYLIKSDGQTWFPNMAFGFDSIPKSGTFFIRGATIWSNDTLGVFEGDVLVKDGEIEQVGKFLLHDPSIPLIGGNGKHLTPGIVDEHSHIAIEKGVNEGTQSSSAEVRIGDVVKANDINIYRQLAGGVTTSHLLHGSANPIGGQSALIKLKWGESADEMLIDDAPGFIKFALGENVKQSNWGPNFTMRFPQTRMGVEQVFYDYFKRAKDYANEWAKYDSQNQKFSLRKVPLLRHLAGEGPSTPRVDLELEALSEILDTNRFISCHSYVQSEINMLMHVADSMKFRVNTFTHVLEGYKVADKLAEHGAAGSTFSDWWAYKFEVNDAIPYNAALMHEQGVLTGINSDDAEMGRRLNQEAAKTVKYGGVSEEEALKMVTLNPAKMLHLDHRIGSVIEGKDADLVLWDSHPLSIYSKPLYTWIEGVPYYTHDQNQLAVERNQQERSRLVKKLLNAADKGYPTKTPDKKTNKLYHCDTLVDEVK
ncbi:amidohydrolase family protein [Salibacter sp.]|uniref:amidohydrolase family protein n=1 Tax=Salibacter sp. TaxID=2010995 RepID=UPI0028703694|nr:amidohydrolase family protein [Salibacter sp.]MDR9487949.1 amidohydrolase family protein [Salibacter sp.]